METTEKNIEELRKSANKYDVISDLVEDEVLESQVLSSKELVDKFVKNQRQPGLEEEAKWTPEMYLYFKKQWELMWSNNNKEVEDVYEVQNGIAKSMVANDVNGKTSGMLNKGGNHNTSF